MIKVVLKEYLQRLRAIETIKPKGEKKKEVPTMDGLADLAGLHRVSLNRIANNHGKALNFETANVVIKAMRDLGFDMQTSDFIAYEEVEA